MKIDTAPPLPTIESIWDDTVQALSLLISNCFYSQLMATTIDKTYRSYNIDYCTIIFKGSRRIGHSTAIAKTAIRFFHSALIISGNKRLSEHIFNIFRIESMIYPNQGNYIFKNLHELHKLNGIDVEAIYIDTASYLSERDNEIMHDHIYELINCSKPFRFYIFIQ